MCSRSARNGRKSPFSSCENKRGNLPLLSLFPFCKMGGHHDTNLAGSQCPSTVPGMQQTPGKGAAEISLLMHLVVGQLPGPWGAGCLCVIPAPCGFLAPLQPSEELSWGCRGHRNRPSPAQGISDRTSLWDCPCGRLASSSGLLYHWRWASLRWWGRGTPVTSHLLLSWVSGVRKQLSGSEFCWGRPDLPPCFPWSQVVKRLPTFSSHTA